MIPQNSNMIIQMVICCIMAGLPCFIWGSPGIGKSAVVRFIAALFGVEMIDLRAILLDPIELRGIPAIDLKKKESIWYLPNFLPKSGFGILFIDELNAAPSSVQAALYQLILDRKLGDYTLPDGWVIICAGNLETDRAVTNRMPTPLANRLIHALMVHSFETWLSWAESDRELPGKALDMPLYKWNKKKSIRIEVRAFLSARPALLYTFDPSKNEKCFASPRIWEYVSELLDVNPPDEVLLPLFSGCVGQGVAMEFVQFLKLFRNMILMDDILNNPDTCTVPHDMGLLYAVQSMIAANMTKANIEKCMVYLERLPIEFAQACLRSATNNNEALKNTKAYIMYMNKHQDLFVNN